MQLFLFILSFILLSVNVAHAYIGPGLGVAAVWVLVGPIAAILMAVAIVAYFPLRYLYKKHKFKKAQAESQASDGADDQSNKDDD